VKSGVKESEVPVAPAAPAVSAQVVVDALKIRPRHWHTAKGGVRHVRNEVRQKGPPIHACWCVDATQHPVAERGRGRRWSVGGSGDVAMWGKSSYFISESVEQTIYISPY
jgi:hypothetical protein